MLRVFFLIIYYGFATWLPGSYLPIIGKICNSFRIFCVKRIFKYCGRISTIDRKVYFGNGKNVSIGDYSGIGANNVLPNDIIIGKYVMMAPDVYILSNNHSFASVNIPMCFQGYNRQYPPTVIEDDVWIGVRVIMTPGRHIKKGSIIAAGSILTKDFEEYSIVGGNPSRLIKKRI